MMNLTDIKRKLQEVLKESRYEHTLGVEYTASCLAMRYGVDPDKARLAGLLHDCAKYLSSDELLNASRSREIAITDVQRENPFLLHAPLGACLAKELYGVRDEEVLSAIRWHTTGRPGMSTLEKIIFLADYIEPNRNHAPNLPMIRELAFQNLDRCCLKVMKDTVAYLATCESVTDPMTRASYEYYKELLDNKN